MKFPLRRIFPLVKCCILPFLLCGAQAFADDFVISTDVFETNGGNTLDGNDSITVTPQGTVTTTSSDMFYTISMGRGIALAIGGIVPTTGRDASGLYAFGDGNTLTNGGIITTIGSAAHGLASRGDGNTLVNSGTITTSGEFAGGVWSGGDGNTLTNSGTIMTSGDVVNGIWSGGDGNTLTNSGTIMTTGSGSAFYAGGDGNRLINSGTITTSGERADGFGFYGEGNIATNSGTIATSGVGAHGLFIRFSDGSMLVNSGTVTTSGTRSEGISTIGNNNTVVNSGRVRSEQSYAISMSGTAATLTLAEGSVLQGGVFFSDAETATLNFEENLNAVVRIESGVPATITAPNDAYAVDGDTVYVLDTRGFVTPDRTIGFVGKLALDALEGRPAQATAGVSTEDSQAGTEFWMQTFGGRFEDDGDADTAAYDSWSAGVLIGLDTGENRGFFLGASLSELENDNDFKLDTDHVLGGIYAGYDLGTLDIDTSLTVGAGRNSSERKVASNRVGGGVDTVTADYNSLFIMPAASVKGDWGIGTGTFTPSLRIRYAAIWQESYTEDNGGNLDVDSRVSHLLDARLQFEHAMSPYDTNTGTLFSSVRAGVEWQYFDQDYVGATIASSPIAFATGVDETAARGYIGLEVRHLSRKGNRQFVASVATGRTTSDLTDVSGVVGWNMRF